MYWTIFSLCNTYPSEHFFSCYSLTLFISYFSEFIYKQQSKVFTIGFQSDDYCKINSRIEDFFFKVLVVSIMF